MFWEVLSICFVHIHGSLKLLLAQIRNAKKYLFIKDEYVCEDGKRVLCWASPRSQVGTYVH